MFFARDFFGNNDPIKVIKWFVLGLVVILFMCVFGWVFIEERRVVMKDYEQNYDKYMQMGCASLERQTEISKKFCDDAEKLIHDPVFVIALKNTIVRLYPCQTLYCYEIFAPIYRSTLSALITVALIIGLAGFLYYMCMGRFGGSSAPQIYLQQPAFQQQQTPQFYGLQYSQPYGYPPQNQFNGYPLLPPVTYEDRRDQPALHYRGSRSVGIQIEGVD